MICKEKCLGCSQRVQYRLDVLVFKTNQNVLDE